MFEKFKDDEGKFKASMINNVRGMLSLYEAAHLAVHGEEILDEAIVHYNSSQVNDISCNFKQSC